MDGDWTYCGDHFVIYTDIKSLCCKPEINIMLYVNSASIKKFEKQYQCNTQRVKYPIQIIRDTGAPGWLSQLSIPLLVSAEVMISQFYGLEPHVGLYAGIEEPAWDSLSLSSSPSDPPPLVLFLSLSK